MTQVCFLVILFPNRLVKTDFKNECSLNPQKHNPLPELNAEVGYRTERDTKQLESVGRFGLRMQISPPLGRNNAILLL